MRLIERLAPGSLGVRFRWLLASAWVSNSGDGLALAAGPLLVASETRSAFLVASAAFLQRLPWLLLGLYAGVIADRVDRRVLVVSSEAFRVIVIGLLWLAILAHQVNIWLVLAAMLLLGVGEVFSITTEQTLTPMLVPGDGLGLANASLQASVWVGQNMIGPPVGAFLFSVGRAWPFMAQAILIAAATLLLARIGSARIRGADGTAPAQAAGGTTAGATPGPPRRSVHTEISEGVRWLLAHPPVRTLALIILAFNITWGAAWSVLVLYALRHLHMSSFGYGLLATSSALGAVISVLVWRRLEQLFSYATLMRGCLTLEVLMHLSFALTKVGWLAILIMFVFGAYAAVWGSVSQTVRQRAVPHELQGRVGSVYLICVFGGIVLGQLIGGALAQRWGVVTPFWFAFAGSGLTLVVVWRRLAVIAHAGDRVPA